MERKLLCIRLYLGLYGILILPLIMKKNIKKQIRNVKQKKSQVDPDKRSIENFMDRSAQFNLDRCDFHNKITPDLLYPLYLDSHSSTSNLTPRHTPSNSSTPPVSPPTSPRPHRLDQPPLFGSSARPSTSSAKGRGFLCGVKSRDEVRRMEPPRRSGVEGKKRGSWEDLLLVCKKKKKMWIDRHAVLSLAMKKSAAQNLSVDKFSAKKNKNTAARVFSLLMTTLGLGLGIKNCVDIFIANHNNRVRVGVGKKTDFLIANDNAVDTSKKRYRFEK